MQVGLVKIGDAIDLECPQTTPFSAFRTAIHSFVTDEPRDFIFGTLAYHSKSHPAEKKSSLKGRGQGQITHFRILHPM